MNKISIEIYKAFASTKPTEFDSFHRDWILEHPTTIEQVTEIQPMPKRKRTLKSKVVAFEIEPEPETPEEETIEDIEEIV